MMKIGVAAKTIAAIRLVEALRYQGLVSIEVPFGTSFLSPELPKGWAVDVVIAVRTYERVYNTLYVFTCIAKAVAVIAAANLIT